MNMEQMTSLRILNGITTCLIIVLLVSSEGIDRANSSCTDGLGLNYTLPMFKECREKQHSNGSLIQTIPKLISLDIGARCPIREGTPRRPHTYRVCRHPDCLRNPCENGWCEETMEGYECHCSAGYQGKACNERDVTPPNVTCVEDITVTVELGRPTPNTSVEFIQPSATDMSGKALLISANYVSGDEFPIGSTVVKYVFADESGNEATCNFTVIVNSIDTTAPDVACIENITVTGRSTGRNTSIEFLQPSATDISGTALLVSKNYGSGDEFPVGSTLVEYVFADESGNQATCTFTITINTYAFQDPVGLESGAIPDSSLTASSAWTAYKHCLPERARLHLGEERIGDDWFCGAWATAEIDSNPWIQVDLLTKYRIGGVSTQGRQRVAQWVTRYKINCSIDEITFDTVQDIVTNPATDKVFVGNNDSSTVVYNALPQPKVCRYVRLLPVDWSGHRSLRMELYGEPPVMDPDWVCMSSKCYREDEKQRSWQDAQSFCRNLSTIATITGFKKPSLLFVDTDEYHDFMSRMGFQFFNQFWINCNDMLNEGDFICDVDGAGTRETTTYWSPGEPNGHPNNDEDCVMVNGWTRVGHWADALCTRSYLTVCQILL